MPKIQAVLLAEAELAAQEKALAALIEERDALTDKLKQVSHEVRRALAPFKEKLEAARAEQRCTLTRWVERSGPLGSPSYTRYVLNPSGPDNRAWGDRAWLRVMLRGGLFRGDGPERRVWTLTVQGVEDAENGEFVLDPREKNPEAPAPDPQVMLAAADVLLVDRGLILTDLSNE